MVDKVQHLRKLSVPGDRVVHKSTVVARDI